MIKIEEALRLASNQLLQISTSPRLDAELLLAFVLKKPRSVLFKEAQILLTTAQQSCYAHYISRRLNHEPIAYLIGKREFWSLSLMVTRDTLIPRPETELLVEETLKILASKNASIKIADLGTGSGAISLALAHENPLLDIHAVDVCPNALKIAKSNAKKLGINNISFHRSHWFQNLNIKEFEIILANPPYLAEFEWSDQQGLHFEPRIALVSGQDGLEDIRHIINHAKKHLKNGGFLGVEHGYSQGLAVREVFLNAGYLKVATFRDLANRERVTFGRWFC